MEYEKDTNILTDSCVCEIQIRKQLCLTVTKLTKQAVIDLNLC